MTPPLNICHTDPEIKFNAMYCIVEVKKSINAGIAIYKGLHFNYLPLDLASSCFILYASGSLLTCMMNNK
jgi:hypothetical protein